MRKVLAFMFALLPLAVSAQHIKKGYHGFVDAGYCAYISQLAPSTVEVTTSHGYQFNPYIFLGAGVGFDFTGYCEWGEVSGRPYNKRESKVDIPVFFNFHSNFTKTRFSPFVDIKAGAYVNNEGGIYMNGAVGCRYAIRDNMGISLSIGYEARKVTVDQIEMTTGNKNNHYNYSFYYSKRPDQAIDGLVIKAGFDF